MEKLRFITLFVSLLAISWALASPVSRNTTIAIETRIFQGSKSKAIYPFFVSIVIKKRGKDNFSVYCGASLIDTTHILTAAHCTQNMTEHMRNGSVFEAWLAPSSINPPKYQQRIKIASGHDIHSYTEYNSKTNANDIAVITLSEPATLNEDVSTVCLGDLNNYNNLKVTLAGFGKTDCIHASNVLRYAVGTTIDLDSCKAKWGYLRLTAVCAKLHNAHKDYAEQATGDSGGPLFTNRGSKNVQIGVVSYGMDYIKTGCPEQKYPGVYTIPGFFKQFLKRYANSVQYCT